MFVVIILASSYLGLRDFLDYRYKKLHDKPPARVVEQDIVIPFELKNGNIALQATIEGIKIKGIFDTGGSYTEINSTQIHPFTTFIPEGVATTGPGWGGVALQSGFFPQVNINGVNFNHVGCYLSYSEKSPLVSFVDGEPHQFSIGNDFFYGGGKVV